MCVSSGEAPRQPISNFVQKKNSTELSILRHGETKWYVSLGTYAKGVVLCGGTSACSTASPGSRCNLKGYVAVVDVNSFTAQSSLLLG